MLRILLASLLLLSIPPGAVAAEYHGVVCVRENAAETPPYQVGFMYECGNPPAEVESNDQQVKLTIGCNEWQDKLGCETRVIYCRDIRPAPCFRIYRPSPWEILP